MNQNPTNLFVGVCQVTYDKVSYINQEGSVILGGVLV